MSSSGRKIFAIAAGVQPDGNNGDILSYRVNYFYGPKIGGMEGDSIFVPLEGRTETELNMLAQQGVLARANADTNHLEDFVLSDIYGGRV